MIRKRLVQLIVTAAIAISAVSISAEGVDSTMTAKLTTDTSVEIAGTANASYVQIVVIKPQAEFSNITSENFEDVVYYTDTLLVTDGSFSCKILVPDTGPNGRYQVKGIFNDESGCEEVTASFYKTTPEYTKQLTTAYLNADADSFPAVFAEYSGVYDESDLFAKELETLLMENAKGISSSFVIAKSGMVNHTFTETPETVATVTDITNMLKNTLMLYHMKYSEDFEASVELYRETMPLAFDENYNQKEFSDLFRVVREEDSLSTDEAYVNAVKKTIGLSLILDGSNADKAKALERYAEELGVSKKTLEDSGFSLLEIAKYIENDESAVKEYAGGMESTVKDAIEALEEKEDSSGSGSSGSSGGSSGSSGNSGSSSGRGNSSFSVGNRENTNTNTEPEQPEVTPEEMPFHDLAEFPWAKGAIETLYHKKIINGKEEGRFAPRDNLTREEAVKLLVSAFSLDAKQEDVTFADCKVDDWYYPYVSIAVKSGIVKGISNELFGTGTNISRQDFAVMLRRTLAAGGCKLNGTNAVSFADSEAISEYARADVDALSANGLFLGDETQRFHPKNNITRAEAAVAIERAMEFAEGS